MATNTSKPTMEGRHTVVKFPPPSGRPSGKGLESITRGGGEPTVKRVLVPDLTTGKK
jgi:hypothetical protein